MFFVVVIILYSQWLVGYNQFMSAFKVVTPEPTGSISRDDQFATGLHQRLTALETACKVARSKLPHNHDGIADNLMSHVDDVEDILYTLGYTLTLDNEDDFQPVFERSEGASSLPEPLSAPVAKRHQTDQDQQRMHD
jgi:hypothetical protein